MSVDSALVPFTLHRGEARASIGSGKERTTLRRATIPSDTFWVGVKRPALSGGAHVPLDSLF